MGSGKRVALADIARYRRDSVAFLREVFGIEPETWQHRLLNAVHTRQVGETMAKNRGIMKVGARSAQLAQWEQELAQQANADCASEMTGTPRIVHKGGILKINGEKVNGNALDVIILAYGFMKTYYATAFDPTLEEGQTPDCYAFALPSPTAEAEMAPHPAAPDKQSETCAGCPHNQFGTAERGQGKRCGDRRRVLCVIPVEDDENGIQAAQVRQIEIPPGSLKNWATYLRGLKEITASGNVRTVITQVAPQATDTGGHALTFRAVGKLDDREQIAAIIAKGKELEPELSLPFPVIKREAPKSKGKSKSKRQIKKIT